MNRNVRAGTIERSDGTVEELTLAIDRRRRVDTAYEVYLGLYQAITGPEDRQKLFREFSPAFFDLIVIDECHRGCGKQSSTRMLISSPRITATSCASPAATRTGRRN